MNKILWVCLFIPFILNAGDLPKHYPGLFAKVQQVAKNDVLNVRKNPTYKSAKVASYAYDDFMMVDFCIDADIPTAGKAETSKWCHVHPNPLMDNGGRGWVNARFLSFINTGYVSISKRKSICDYALNCEMRGGEMVCLVVTSLGIDSSDEGRSGDEIKLNPETEWIERSLLQPESAFSAADDADLNPEGDFCTSGRMVEDYYRENPQKRVLHK